MLKLLLISFIAITLSGCASVKYNGAETTAMKIDYPAIGKIVTVSVGDELVAKGTIYESNVLVVHSLIDGVLYDIPPKKYQQIGFDQQDDFFSAEGVSRSVLADPIKALALGKKSGSQLCVITTFNVKECYDGKYSRTRHAAEYSDSFQQTLIYSGRIGDKLNISYREFSNNTARPAYNNDVEYDFSSSNTIGYKGAKLEIINADNDSITYKLLSNFK